MKKQKKMMALMLGILLLLVSYSLETRTQPVALSTPPQLAEVAATAASTEELLVQNPENTYQIVRVVDGDTVTVLMDGEIVKLRLIGLDTPETVDPRKSVQCFGKAARDMAKELLTDAIVRLEFDASQGTLDTYGRTLAYVFLSDPSTLLGASGISFNEYMIAEGYAHEYTYKLPYKYQERFKAAEMSAREQKKGLWANDTCAGNTKQPVTL